jgi:hypothetical protein
MQVNWQPHESAAPQQVFGSMWSFDWTSGPLPGALTMVCNDGSTFTYLAEASTAGWSTSGITSSPSGFTRQG